MNRAGSRPRGFIPSRRTDARTVQASAGVPGRNANAGGGEEEEEEEDAARGGGGGDDERDATRARSALGAPALASDDARIGPGERTARGRGGLGSARRSDAMRR